jgi:hypothetical protein
MSLFEKQRWVNDVFISDGVVDYGYGGRPFDFGKDSQFKSEYEQVFHLGFRDAFHSPNLTLIAAKQSNCNINLDGILAEPSIAFEKKPMKNLCIHTQTASEGRRLESTHTIFGVLDRLAPLFEKIYIIDKQSATSEYQHLLSDKTTIFDDEGDLNRTVDLLSESMFVGTYGSMWALSNCMKIKQVVIKNSWDTCCHDKGSYEDEKWVMAFDGEALVSTVTSLRG